MIAYNLIKKGCPRHYVKKELKNIMIIHQWLTTRTSQQEEAKVSTTVSCPALLMVRCCVDLGATFGFVQVVWV